MLRCIHKSTQVPLCGDIHLLAIETLFLTKFLVISQAEPLSYSPANIWTWNGKDLVTMNRELSETASSLSGDRSHQDLFYSTATHTCFVFSLSYSRPWYSGKTKSPVFRSIENFTLWFALESAGMSRTWTQHGWHAGNFLFSLSFKQERLTLGIFKASNLSPWYTEHKLLTII